jgi:4-carboxymuconolactone decarboxylase
MAIIETFSDRNDLSSDRHEEYDAIVRTLHGVRGPFAVLLWSPGLAQKVMEAGAQVRLGSTLAMSERELAVLSVARENDGAYEWAAHVDVARREGTSEAAIEAVRDRSHLDGLTPDERDIIDYVRQIHRTNRVEGPLSDRMIERHGERWFVELAATVGQYRYIATINNTFGVTPAEDADQLPM